MPGKKSISDTKNAIIIDTKESAIDTSECNVDTIKSILKKF
jgi:hypothetical protein